jgi:hypothetical protein
MCRGSIEIQGEPIVRVAGSRAIEYRSVGGLMASRLDRSLAAQAGSPLLVCGHSKSGTSLLMSLLDGHPDVLVFPGETKYFRDIHGRPEFGTAEALLTQTRISRLAGDRHVARELGRDHRAVDQGVFEDELRALFAEPVPESDLLPAIVLAYARAIGESPRRYWVEKTPRNEHHLDTALTLWPGLKAIYIARDPRDIYASFRKKREKRGKRLPVGTFVRRMHASLSIWGAFAERHPERSVSVRYEDLVREPRETTQQIANFLGIEWHSALVSPTQVGRHWGGNSMYGETHSDISPTPIGRYSVSLTRSEIRALEYRLRPVFERFSWPLAASDRSGGRLGDWAAVIRSSLFSDFRRPGGPR